MNEKVFVYYNLHKHVWSVKALTGPHRGKVIKHCDSIQLHTVTFKVSEAGRQRVLREQCKNVHAGAVGYSDHGEHVYYRQVSYNPYKYDHFYLVETGEPVYNSSCVLLKDKKVWIS